jgi:spermidine/putrescine transport system ATP-binding protein
MSAMVELRDVSKVFGTFTALRRVSFDIAESEFMTFLGPSGCGKTTCLRLISGFDTPTTGQIFIGGWDVTHIPPYKRDVNQVFQSYALFPHLTIYDNIAFGLRMKKIAPADIKRRVDQVVGMTGLDEMVHRKPSQMSGGQRQRVALARAIVCEPKVLLLDEPLSALDAKLRQQMRTELKSLQKKLGITFIFVTHDQEEALTMSDRIAVLNAGAIEQIGTVSEIYHHPKTRFVAEFIGETNILHATTAGSEGGFVVCRMEDGAVLKVQTTANAAPGPVLLSVRPEKVEVFREKPTGENVFAATISLEIFKGAVDDLIVTANPPCRMELSAMHANASGSTDFHEGEQVFFRLAPENISLLQSSPSTSS